MECYNLIFFHVFKFYFKDGNYKNDIPWLTASVLMAASSLAYSVGATAIIAHLLNMDLTTMVNRHVFIVGAFIFVFANNMYFRIRDRYMAIFEKYRNSQKDTMQNAILCWLIVIGGFISVPVLLFLLNN